MAAIFNFYRMGLLVRRFFVENRNRELYYWAIFTIVFIFLRNQSVAIGALILIAGMVFCGRFFREIHSPVTGLNYFMIPATQAEKTVVTIFLTTIYYFGMMLVVYAIGNLAGTFLNNLFANFGSSPFGSGFFAHDPLKWMLFENVERISGIKGNFGEEPLIWTYFKAFVFIQAIFTLGSLYFKRSAIFKTILTLFVFGLVCAIIMGLVMKGFLNNSTLSNTSMDININVEIPGFISYLLIPYLWILGYFRLTEKEV